jgi:hypothetical protein
MISIYALPLIGDTPRSAPTGYDKGLLEIVNERSGLEIGIFHLQPLYLLS